MFAQCIEHADDRTRSNSLIRLNVACRGTAQLEVRRFRKRYAGLAPGTGLVGGAHTLDRSHDA
jgi:hypothetical protein